MREGSLEAPIRHPIAWQDPDYTDPDKLDAEMRRQFDVCHTCRLCFNLCDSFPRLFDLIDESETGEVDGVSSDRFKHVADACTLCDMCFMTKCPYVPPHEFDMDIPHLLLRYRAMEQKQGKRPFWEKQLTDTDRNGRLCGHAPGLVNWAGDTGNRLTRSALQAVAGVDRDAALPRYHRKTLVARAGDDAPEVNPAAPAYGRKAVIYATCFSNYNDPQIGIAARRVLARNGVETEIVYPSCCGMPKMEQGDLAQVAANARTVAAELRPWVDKGYDVIGLVPSCVLMLKFEWPLIVPDDENVEALSRAVFDTTEYVVSIARKEGLAEGLGPLDGAVTLHIACHSRAQNVGTKAAELMRLIPDVDLKVIQRCSGHGGSWGVMKGNFETALKVGKPVARDAAKAGSAYVISECPLAATHILQGVERIEGEKRGTEASAMPAAAHPIELFARAYGIEA